jgi:DNA-binding SARP family transcriptional activator
MNDSKSILSIRLLGSFSANIDNCAVAKWSRKSALYLLQALALSPDFRLTRAQIAQYLTEDDSNEHARLVSDALYALKHQSVVGHPTIKMLGEYILASQEAVWLDKTRCCVDIAEIELAADVALSDTQEIERLGDVVERCRGPIMPDIAPLLESLAVPARTAIEQKYLTCARSLVSHYIRESQDEKAILVLQNLLRVTPGDEEGHRQLIEIFSTLGRYHEAEQQLTLCRTVLARDLGLRPSDATISAIRTARERRVSSTEPAKTNAKSVEKETPFAEGEKHVPPKPLTKLIGRGATLEDLHNLLLTDDGPRLMSEADYLMWCRWHWQNTTGDACRASQRIKLRKWRRIC